MAPPRLSGLTKLTLETAPSVCHDCVWWQSRSSRRDVDKERWMTRVEEEFGAFGTIYYGDDGRTLGSIQYGPAPLFPHAWELPAGPPSEDAMLITCAYLVDASAPWVLQSLFLAAIGEARDRGASCVEAFAYRYVEGETVARAVPASTGRSSRPTSSATSASASCGRRGGSGWRGSSSAGSCRSRRGRGSACCGW